MQQHPMGSLYLFKYGFGVNNQILKSVTESAFVA